MSLGKRLREERKRRHLTQDEVAAVLETTKQAIYKYERGIVENIPFDKLNKLAELFECSPAYLMGWTDDSQPLPPSFPSAPVLLLRTLSGGLYPRSQSHRENSVPFSFWEKSVKNATAPFLSAVKRSAVAKR